MGIFNKRSRKIKRLLIANRGEIAVRIIATARQMGITTYVIKSPREPKALYLQLADKVINVSGYEDDISIFLDVEKLIALALKNNIDAVHPGYGFLSESPYFAQRCEEEKIIFVGPSAEAIYKMGNKTIARQLAAKNNIPLIKGSIDSLKSDKDALAYAHEIGYPVMLKAAAGGGGRGIRIVDNDKELITMFRMASAEAEKAFGNSALFIEKYVASPKHIEFQIVGDKHGNIIHLGERECSIQRKHQKLVEEAPSPALTDELRTEMGQMAIRIAKSINYYSLGTVEFLLDEQNNYYFMEMNTRIQVEHPVTEMITGLDLVELQLIIAQDEQLPLNQDDVQIKGWAIECRINAEDVQSNFAACTGFITNCAFPQAKNIRIDNGVQSGSEISSHYDSMMAKLIGYGDTRRQAIANTLNALRRCRIKGMKTTIPFAKAVLSSSEFKEGKYDTSFVERNSDKLIFREPSEELLAAIAATVDFIERTTHESTIAPDYNKGKEMDPWILNKRIKSI